MSARELLLLSTHRLPTQNTLYLADDDVAAFLNGYTALWHPAALAIAAGPPQLASPYDHEQPVAGRLYALPESPPLLLPDDWEQLARENGTLFFRATADRATTLANLKEALRGQSESAALLDLGPEQTAPFFGVGFGKLQLDALCEAMSHDNLLATADFWQDVSAAVAALTTGGEPRLHLRSAAERLLSAREVLYSVSIHLLDIALPDEGAAQPPWPGSFDKGLACNVIACAALLERLGKEQPECLAALRERVAADLAEVCGGPYLEREDALLPVESQVWNLLKGQAVYQELLGREVRVFGRKRFGFHPQLPQLLQNVGLTRALLLTFDESVLPDYRSTVVNWPAKDGKQVEAFPRAPHPADTPQTFFHLAHHLYQTIMKDQAATLALLHRTAKPAAPWYDDWLELSRLAPVLGTWKTFSAFFNDVGAGDYASPAEADEFRGDYLVERTTSTSVLPGSWQEQPVSGLTAHLRARRQLDTAWALAALYRGLGGEAFPDREAFESTLRSLEDRLESMGPLPVKELSEAQDRATVLLARRLVARGKENQPGFLVLNPCSFLRRVALELADVTAPLPLDGALKACQVADGVARLVIEVPALGFAWIPKTAPAAAAPHPGRMRLADDRCVRNEFFEAEIDAATGGLRSIRDPRTRIPRLGQQLVFNPGSTMRVHSIRTTSTGPALGEIITEGELVDTQQQVLAAYRQRFRAWIGRPVLDLRIEIRPVNPAHGYPWHAYYAARFAWRDERATLLRGVHGTGYITSHTRPETPDYLEIRIGRQNTVVFPGGLPFHQRHGSRMLDVILAPEGETYRSFDLAIGLDRDYPMQTALGLVTPVPVAATAQGPPHVGATGWLFHLDAPNLLLTSLRPAPDGADGVIARLLECSGHGGAAEFRCVRNPRRATFLDARGNGLLDAPTQGDAVQLDAARHDLIQLRADFS
jgi:hypothetical protein